MHDALKVLLFSLSAFGILFVLARLMGKKQIAELDFVDYVIGISMGSISASMAFDHDKPFYAYLIALGVFFILSVVLSIITRKTPFLKWLLHGKPSVLVYEGKIDYQNVKKSGIDINSLLSMLREQGYFDISQVRYALLETSGQISVLPVGAERPAVAKDLPIEINEPRLANYLVIDGLVSKSGLSEIGKDEKWLYRQLGVTKKKELKKVFLCEFDAENRQIFAHYKNKDSEVRVIKIKE